MLVFIVIFLEVAPVPFNETWRRFNALLTPILGSVGYQPDIDGPLVKGSLAWLVPRDLTQRSLQSSVTGAILSERSYSCVEYTHSTEGSP